MPEHNRRYTDSGGRKQDDKLDRKDLLPRIKDAMVNGKELELRAGDSMQMRNEIDEIRDLMERVLEEFARGQEESLGDWYEDGDCDECGCCQKCREWADAMEDAAEAGD